MVQQVLEVQRERQIVTSAGVAAWSAETTGRSATTKTTATATRWSTAAWSTGTSGAHHAALTVALTILTILAIFRDLLISIRAPVF